MNNVQETPLSAFLKWEKEVPDRIFLRQPVNDLWKTWTYREAGEEARRIASAIAALRLPPNSKIALLSKNCAHWIMADLAIMITGHVSVPVYATLSAAGVSQILSLSGAALVFLGKLDDYDSQRSGVPADIHKISFPFYGPADGLQWNDLLGLHAPVAEVLPPDPSDLASIMYSSGTTGTPKGVMLTFGAFGFVGKEIKVHLQLADPQRFFSYLPLSHIAERAYLEMVALSSGSTISFTESLQKFQQNLMHEQPTAFGGVPRIYAKFQEGVLRKIPQKKLDRLLAIPLVSMLIRRTIVKKLGLSKARVVISGGAPCPPSVLKWFATLGVHIRESYGMTENTAYSHSNYGEIRIGTVGQPLPGVEVKTGEGGEILVRNAALMKGYYNDPVTTAGVFTSDGFLKTGDQGVIDAGGFLTITGRMKDQFKTDKGKFIAPAPIELKFSVNTGIDQVCVVGTGLAQPIALVTLSENGAALPHAQLVRQLQQTLLQVNESLEKHEHVRMVVILNDQWTIENGMITPSMKVKRNVVEKKYASRYEEWYAHAEEVIRDSEPAGKA